MKRPTTTTLRAIALTMPLLLAGMWGCSRMPPAAEPVTPAELTSLVEDLSAAAPAANGYRGTGDGEIRVSGRTLKVSFAVVYDRPQWMRADLRPKLGTFGAAYAAQALMDGDCASMYLPAKLVEVTGCLSDVAGSAGWGDPVSLILGLTDASFIAGLSDVTMTRDEDRIVIQGRASETRVAVGIDGLNWFITDIELERPDSEETLTLTYDGHGWKEGLSAPQTVELTALEGTSDEVGVILRYETLRRDDDVDREQYDVSIPPGVLQVDWRDLSIWR